MALSAQQWQGVEPQQQPAWAERGHARCFADTGVYACLSMPTATGG